MYSVQDGRFIQVILPLKLEWEPFYSMEGTVCVGTRVTVRFAHRSYVGVVSAIDAKPSKEMNILPAGLSSLPPVTEEEIRFWRYLADYYLCTVGEVYKAAYPSLKTEQEAVEVRIHERLEKRLLAVQSKLEKAKKDSVRERYKADLARLQAILEGNRPPFLEGDENPLSPQCEKACKDIQSAFSAGRTALLEGGIGAERLAIGLELARRTLSAGKNVLLLVPEIALTRHLEEQVAAVFPDLLVYHSARTSAARRAVGSAIRSGVPYIVLGTRSALFLPHQKLGLIVVDQEQDSSYKQDSPAPRYHAREAAIFLGITHGASVLLSSETPSLESLYNVETGLFAGVKLQQSFQQETILVNISAEQRKRGMAGSFSLKLLSAVKDALDAGEKVLVISRSRQAQEEDSAEFNRLYPAIPAESISFITPVGIKLLPAQAFPLAVIIQADGLLGKEDFRADEKALQMLRQIPCRRLLIQTREDKHPVFQALVNGLSGLAFLRERRAFGYPPFARMIDVVVTDKNEKRLDYLSEVLVGTIKSALPSEVTTIGPFIPMHSFPEASPVRLIRLLFPKNSSLRCSKAILLSTVAKVEKERKYPGHIHFDVDPV